MHIHATQVNPSAALNELNEIQKAAAKRQSEKVRKKLLEAPAEVDAESDSYVVRLGAREEGDERNGPGGDAKGAWDRQGEKQEKAADSAAARKSISDWA